MRKSDEEAIADGIPTPHFINEQEAALFAEAVLGDDAMEFLNSELGQYVRGCAKQDQEDAKSQLLKVDPENTSEIRKLQMKAKVAGSLIGYLAEIVQRGSAAADQLEQMRQEP